jgi:hypothetical protein
MLPLSSELVEMLGTERQRADQEAERASAEAKRADRATSLAEAETNARVQAEAEIARLRAELDALRKSD